MNPSQSYPEGLEWLLYAIIIILILGAVVLIGQGIYALVEFFRNKSKRWKTKK